jgi:serine/threonine-protein kinase
MEYVPGPTLQDLLNEREGHLGYARIGSIVEQIASGLQAIHDAGFVHGDVKPSNVLLGPAGRVCVTDLGLARRTETYTPKKVGKVAGTAEFLAPERITGELRPELACRSDVYALAVLAYELVGGLLPFRGANSFALAHQHVTATPQPLGELRDDVPAALQLCVMQGLAKDPETRTASCALFRDAFLAGLRAPEPEHAQMGPVLVVDDDPDFCELLAEVVRLELNPSAVDVVYRGKDALAAIEARAYAVVLLDLALPDIAATELAARISAALTSPPPIVVITGQGTAADWQELSALGVKGFHLKPIIPAALAAHVRHVVSAAS